MFTSQQLSKETFNFFWNGKLVAKVVFGKITTMTHYVRDFYELSVLTLELYRAVGVNFKIQSPDFQG